jgi:hypothetical protein
VQLFAQSLSLQGPIYLPRFAGGIGRGDDQNGSTGLQLLGLCAFTAGSIASTGESICEGGNPVAIGSAAPASGGNGVFSYQWQANGVDIPGATSLTYDPPAGLTTTTEYKRYAKDGDCVTTFTASEGSWLVTVTTVLPGTSSILITEASGTTEDDGVICMGEAATLTAASGLSFLWSNGATTASIQATTTDSYAVTVTGENGCTATASTDILVNGLPTALVTQLSTNCGSADLEASGGIQYAWSGGSQPASAVNTVLQGGSYEVTVTDDQGCTATNSINVFLPAAPSAIIQITENGGVLPNDGILCSQEMATLTASGGVLYDWSTGATNANIQVGTSGVFEVTVTDVNGCTATASQLITVHPLPTVTASVTENSGTFPNDGQLCAGATATLTASPAGTYQWSTGATSSTINVTSEASYAVTVTDTNGCSNSSTTSIEVDDLPSCLTIFTPEEGAEGVSIDIGLLD